MSEQEIGNTQTAQPTPATPAGPSMEELQARVAEFERKNEGILRDLQSERAKRQELEARLAPAAPSPVQQDVNGDELAKVLDPYLAPIKKQLAQAESEKAMSFLVANTGKTREQIETDTAFQDKLVQTVRKWNLVGSTYDITKRAYELMRLEESHNREQERIRQVNAANAASLPAGTPPAPRVGSREFTAEEFAAMDKKVGGMFHTLSQQGEWKKVGDKFVHVPRN